MLNLAFFSNSSGFFFFFTFIFLSKIYISLPLLGSSIQAGAIISRDSAARATRDGSGRDIGSSMVFKSTDTFNHSFIQEDLLRFKILQPTESLLDFLVKAIVTSIIFYLLINSNRQTRIN